MAPRNWLELVLHLAREGDSTADFRRKMLDEQVRHCMDGMAEETKLKINEDRIRGILRRTA
jgi:hypothetical protein